MKWALETDDIGAIRDLRQQVMHQLRRHANPEDDFASTEVVVAELLSNVLAHTPGRAWISLRWDGVHPLLSVSDLGQGFPTGGTGRLPDLIDTERSLRPRLPADPLAPSGRGLYLVSRLALDVAVATRATGGSVVSVTLNLRLSAAPAGRADDWLTVRPG